MSRLALEEVVKSQFEEASSAHEALLKDVEAASQLITWAKLSAKSLSKGGTLFFAGNGGSFADAQHMAAELTGKMGRMRRSLSGIALGTNGSSISAVGNDFGYENSFSREFEGLYRPDSVIFAFSTSGNSENVLNLARKAKLLKTPMLCLTGASGGRMASECEVLSVPSERTERVQELHTLIGHTFCLCIEELMELSDEPYDSPARS